MNSIYNTCRLIALVMGLTLVVAAQTGSVELAELSRVVTSDIGTVEGSSRAKTGAPIVIFKETHNSIGGQVEQALMLNRLYLHHRLRDIALEGFVGQFAKLNTEWFRTAAHGDAVAMAEVAARLLRDGEIGGAEFMSLVYADINVRAIEKKDEYDAAHEALNSASARNIIVRIAKKQDPKIGDQEVTPRLKEAVQLYKDAEKVGNLEIMAKYRAVMKEELDVFYDRELQKLSGHELLLRAYRMLTSTKWTETSSITDYVKTLKDIQERAKKDGIAVSEEENKQLQSIIDFYETRNRASKTMATRAAGIAKDAKGAPVALIIGGAHTIDVKLELTNIQHSFLVVRPKSYEGDNQNFGGKALLRKYEGKSLYYEGLSSLIDHALEGKKPEPVVEKSWFEAKAELYLFTDRLAKKFITGGGKGGPPVGGGRLPGEPDDAEFRGRFIFIDQRRVEIRDEGSRNGRRTFSIVFPISLNYADPRKRREIWGKATLASESVSVSERKTVEEVLKKVLAEVASTREVVGAKVEDKMGRVQITFETVAAFGETEAVKEAVLISI